MAIGLVVREPFGDYVRGTVIVGDAVQGILSGYAKNSVVKFAIEEPKPDTAQENAHLREQRSADQAALSAAEKGE